MNGALVSTTPSTSSDAQPAGLDVADAAPGGPSRPGPGARPRRLQLRRSRRRGRSTPAGAARRCRRAAPRRTRDRGDSWSVGPPVAAVSDQVITAPSTVALPQRDLQRPGAAGRGAGRATGAGARGALRWTTGRPADRPDHGRQVLPLDAGERRPAAGRARRWPRTGRRPTTPRRPCRRATESAPRVSTRAPTG